MKRVVGGTKWWQVRGIRGHVYIFLLTRSSYLTSVMGEIQIGCRVGHCQKGLAERAEARQGARGFSCLTPETHSGAS